MIDKLLRLCEEGSVSAFALACLKGKTKDLDIYAKALKVPLANAKKFSNSYKVKQHILSFSSDLYSICVYNKKELQLAALSRNVIIKEIIMDKDDEIVTAELDEVLCVVSKNNVSIYTSTGIPLYKIDMKSKETPKIYNKGGYVILDYKYEVYVINPYTSKHNKVSKKKSAMLLGCTVNYEIFTVKDTAILCQAYKRINSKGCIIVSFCDIFIKNSLEYIGRKPFNTVPAMLDVATDINYQQLTDNSVSVRIGNGKEYVIVNDGEGIACGHSSISDNKVKIAATYTKDDKKILILIINGNICFGVCKDEEVRVFHHVEVRNSYLSIDAVDENNIILMNGDKIIKLNLSEQFVQEFTLRIPSDRYLYSANTHTDNRLIVTGFSLDTNTMKYEQIIELSDKGEA